MNSLNGNAAFPIVDWAVHWGQPIGFKESSGHAERTYKKGKSAVSPQISLPKRTVEAEVEEFEKKNHVRRQAYPDLRRHCLRSCHHHRSCAVSQCLCKSCQVIFPSALFFGKSVLLYKLSTLMARYLRLHLETVIIASRLPLHYRAYIDMV